MNKAKDFTEKNKKSEILEAYHQLLKELQQKKSPDPKEIKQKKEEVKILEKTKNLSTEKIIRFFSDLKLQITKDFDTLEEDMIAEYKKLQTLREAIELEQKNLHEIHQIQINADSLAALLEAQKKYKQEFDARIEEEKDDWEKEQKRYEQERKEYKMNIEKQRKREEDEYHYNTTKQRKQEEDKFIEKKTALEKTLEEQKNQTETELRLKKEEMLQKEEEYAQLKTQVEKFPNKLEISIKEAEKNIKNSLTKEYEHQIALMNKEMEGNNKLYEQKIVSLEKEIQEQKTLMNALTQKANQSSEQVQNIALKAVEGAFPRNEMTLKSKSEE